ncbi:DUF551 domain-containing protein, partial [Oceanidesulfovibrio indonesiensis]|uniref:DUF551 domain-containing protein n=1 Tax=Oceanidesulfovibrio indonesiensis TaxID=54767 RepID=UPI0011872DC9
LHIALASLEAEPVAWTWEIYGGGNMYAKIKPTSLDAIPLYTAPPAPVSVPAISDEEIYALAEKHDAVIACSGEGDYSGNSDSIVEFGRALLSRAAMLQGAEPVSNRDELPDGWVACSERMPNIGVPVSVPAITSCGDVVHCAVYVWDGKEWQDWYEEYDKLPFSTFTHWMALPAA